MARPSQGPTHDDTPLRPQTLELRKPWTVSNLITRSKKRNKTRSGRGCGKRGKSLRSRCFQLFRRSMRAESLFHRSGKTGVFRYFPSLRKKGGFLGPPLADRLPQFFRFFLRLPSASFWCGCALAGRWRDVGGAVGSRFRAFRTFLSVEAATRRSFKPIKALSRHRCRWARP